MSALPAPDYSGEYDPERDFDHWYTVLTARRVAPWLAPGARVLEAGSATGLLTAALCGEGRRFTCLERSARYAARARARGLPGVAIIEGLIEEFSDPEPFDHVLALNVLHEVPQMEAALARLAGCLAPGGLLHITLPNPQSLHRIVALHAGLIGSLHEISERGRRFHTLRLPEAEEVAAMLARHELAEVARTGILVKPLPNAEMARLPPAVIEGFDALATTLPQHGAMTYFVARRHG